MTPMAGKIEVILYSVTVAVATEGATVLRRTVPIRHLADQSYTNLSTYNTVYSKGECTGWTGPKSKLV